MFGISIYPEKSSKEEIFEYIERAAKYGFKRIFSCLLSVNTSSEQIKKDFKQINTFAKEHGFEIIVDVSPKVFSELEISYNDLSYFKEINADGIRLDMGFGGSEESIMTFNEQNLLIEINMSNDTHYLETIMDYMPNKKRLIGCHNFYPHNYSGLTLEHFKKCTARFKKYGLRTAAFITSQNDDTFGPWPVKEGLPTLEIHRHIPIEIQAKHLVSMGDIDDIIISNCYPSEDELIKLSQISEELLTLKIEVIEGLPIVEKSIIFDMLHFNRGDVSHSFIRSTQSRVKYKGHKFGVYNPVDIKRGDVIIESSEYGHYAGEIQIAKIDMKNSGKSNVVGRIPKEEHFLIDTIKPWQKFKFI
ncbi:MAG: DUF871 domain-containing protein [Sarcina sp.]